MLKSEMQHQFWVTKKAVQRRLGSKEDECIVSSDAELDAKIELFKSISESCGHLYRIIDSYQERACILAQEENALGKFLKETGKNSNTTGKIMLSTGKAISYCGQQRMAIRPPLLRLHHEVDTFRGRAIGDTQSTILAMERERTEYRAALSWMKSASNQLDPDTGKGLEKFRKAQTHVRLAKVKFDRLSLDCLQKIDLLAAARCNMFSHALVSYVQALIQFTTKSTETFKATSKALANGPQYNFCILKDLTQTSQQDEVTSSTHDGPTVQPIDSDQMLFFLDDYKDEKTVDDSEIQKSEDHSKHTTKIHDQSGALIDVSGLSNILNLSENASENNVKQIDDNSVKHASIKRNDPSSSSADLLGLSNDFMDFPSSMQPPSFMPSQLLLQSSQNNLFSNIEGDGVNSYDNNLLKKSEKSKNSILDLFNLAPSNKGITTSNVTDEGIQKIPSPSSKLKDTKNQRKDMSAWFQLFSELDPLANPDALARKIDGGKDNSQAA